MGTGGLCRRLRASRNCQRSECVITVIKQLMLLWLCYLVGSPSVKGEITIASLENRGGYETRCRRLKRFVSLSLPRAAVPGFPVLPLCGWSRVRPTAAVFHR